MSGKGDKPRPYSIPRAELEIRDALWRAKDEDKPAMIERLNKMVKDRLQHEK